MIAQLWQCILQDVAAENPFESCSLLFVLVIIKIKWMLHCTFKTSIAQDLLIHDSNVFHSLNLGTTVAICWSLMGRSVYRSMRTTISWNADGPLTLKASYQYLCACATFSWGAKALHSDLYSINFKWNLNLSVVFLLWYGRISVIFVFPNHTFMPFPPLSQLQSHIHYFIVLMLWER